VGAEAFFYGKLGMFKGTLQIVAPRFELVRTGREPFNVGRIIPIYPATADVSSDQLRKLMWETLERVGPILDPLDEFTRRRLRLLTREQALRLIHFPDAKEDVYKARDRLVFDEVFTLQLGLVYRKSKLERTVRGIAHARPTADSLPETFVAALPFKLTGAQRRACEEVTGDMERSCPMHRLIEGEVGSGKTVVALYACLSAIAGGYQAAFMAPTEVLAEQHALTVGELLERAFGEVEGRDLFAGISKRPVVRLLTGSTAAAQRQEILSEVAAGEVDLLIGTHALIEEGVAFLKLGLAVVDEQHRFGVHQRKSLRDKGADGEPDILVMTATPIPRSLAVTIYGDLDVSILDELPKGRRPIETRIATGDADRKEAYELIRREAAAGRQAFIVYALRDESSKVELRSAKGEAKRLAAEVFPDLRVGLVHGDMPSADKDHAMSAFRDGDVDRRCGSLRTGPTPSAPRTDRARGARVLLHPGDRSRSIADGRPLHPDRGRTPGRDRRHAGRLQARRDRPEASRRGSALRSSPVRDATAEDGAGAPTPKRDQEGARPGGRDLGPGPRAEGFRKHGSCP
jgi:ATP-dependent DNA helicase RecG